PLPAAIGRRRDLSGWLLVSSSDLLSWGLLLAARYPQDVPEEAFLVGVARTLVRPELLPALAKALENVRFASLGGPLLRLYLQLDSEEREVLAPALSQHAPAVQAALSRRRDVEAGDRLVLSALLGRPADEVAAEILAIEPQLVPPVVGRLMGLEAVVRSLPWNRWREEAPQHFSTLAAEAAGRFGLRELLPALRARTAKAPTAELIGALGDLGDREAVPLLVELLATAEDLRPTLLESLGRIGGPEARRVLREVVAASAAAGAEARMAFRALVTCADPGDEELLRRGALHPDWYVRLTVIDALGRSGSAESQAALARLAADPVPAVAHRALQAISG
ncbi:MAG TPA: HEAT repeat domain-containing protein, partial [Thermoanaerobaculia bacterium]